LLIAANTRSTLVELVLVSLVGVRHGSVVVTVQELVSGNGREGSSLVDDRCLVDLFRDGDGVVNRSRLDGFTLDNRLDGLVDVVVFVSPNMSAEMSTGSLDFSGVLEVLVHRPLLVEFLLVLGKHVLLVLAGDNGGHGVHVLGLELLFVDNGLDSVLVVVDVPLPVDGLGSLGVLLRTDVLLDDLWGGLRAYLGGVGLLGALQEVLDALSNARHCVCVGVLVWGLKVSLRVRV